ncbi:hypothetical protein VTL71DRAFT_11922 [Oculimacula yallundae]|uniref:N-acetyltransferase domain-containing protein n=1 Tax=Oculimacula yallundae TaxID=86028 RepID=A0ABR4CRH5_9HELO
MQLDNIATHPDFQGQGVGTKLMAWGLKTAFRENQIVTLFASPGAAELYTHLGIDSLVNLNIPSRRRVGESGGYLYGAQKLQNS